MSKTVQRFASLELGWLARRDKLLPVPEVLFSHDGTCFSGGRCSGCYYRPERKEYLFGDVYVPFDRGAILVSTKDPEEIASTLAHEWRHHWQLHHGLLPGKLSFNMNRFDDWNTYDAAIRDYFHSQAHEMDALMFQRSATKQTPFTDETMDRVFGGK